MDALTKLQQWYLAQCNGDWEHSFGISITSLDNPGWILEVDLEHTALAGKAFAPLHYGMFDEAGTSGHEWIHCRVEDNKFSAAGGPMKLPELIDVFLAWAAD
jgi:hypothetical protein